MRGDEDGGEEEGDGKAGGKRGEGEKVSPLLAFLFTKSSMHSFLDVESMKLSVCASGTSGSERRR